jgi:hypothetical protein
MSMHWTQDWLVGAPMMLTTIAFHVSGLCVLEWGLRWYNRDRSHDHSFGHFLLLMVITAYSVMSLHIFEGLGWAALYVSTGAQEDYASSVLYSLNALTSYGHERLDLAYRWQLLGAIESMSGMITFGLTTAFIFGAMVMLRPQRESWSKS